LWKQSKRREKKRVIADFADGSCVPASVKCHETIISHSVFVARVSTVHKGMRAPSAQKLLGEVNQQHCDSIIVIKCSRASESSSQLGPHKVYKILSKNVHLLVGRIEFFTLIPFPVSAVEIPALRIGGSGVSSTNEGSIERVIVTVYGLWTQLRGTARYNDLLYIDKRSPALRAGSHFCRNDRLKAEFKGFRQTDGQT
jgi:hypothetical protein